MKIRNNIIQPNQITVARYNYSVWEKRIMYKIIQLLQKEMQKEIALPKSKYDVYFEFSHKDIDTDYNAQRHVRKALDSLSSKKIIIQKENYYWTGNLINWGLDKDGKIFISISNMIIPFLTDIAKGFTAYSAVVAMTLKSTYSQRIYELCSRFKDTKKWFVSPDELREIFQLPKSYEDYKNIRTRLLEAPMKELKALFEAGQSDLYFTYEEVREGKGRGGAVKELIFTIHTAENENTNNKANTSNSLVSKFQTIANFMRESFDTSIEANVKFINNFLAKIDSLNIDFDELIKKIMIAKNKKNPAAYFRTILKKEFNYKE